MTESAKIIKKYWVMRHPFRALFSLVAIAVGALFCIAFWIYYTELRDPTCDYWKPGMTRDEKVHAALELVNQRDSLNFEKATYDDGLPIQGHVKQVPYEDIKIILDNSPDCCRIMSVATAESNLRAPIPPEVGDEQLISGDEGGVFIRYTARVRDQNGKVFYLPARAYVNFTECNQ